MFHVGCSKALLIKRVSMKQIHVSMKALDCQPFLMPAMSPTMEKGGIVEWKVKVGEPFSTGDLLLEVETDKAQIDVEAQDVGKLAKILVGNGAKDIDVGRTIAFIAESDDDLSTLVIPEVQESKKPELKKESKKVESKPIEKAASTPVKKVDIKVLKPAFSTSISSKADPNQTLLPSVALELSLNNISQNEAVQKIQATGAKGRLLKGDVLAYLGKISKDSVTKIASYIQSGEKLDFSNIQLRVPTPTEETTKPLSKESKISKDPLFLVENIVLRTGLDVNLEQLRATLRSYVDSMYRRSHGEPISEIESEYFDPLFEDLITPDLSKPRFKVNYELMRVHEGTDTGYREESDIFDLLSGEREFKKDNNQEIVREEYMLSLNVKVDETYADSLEKAVKFIDYMKQLEF